jgi:hypothetical protein
VITADNITDEQIRELHSSGLVHVDVVDQAMFGTRDERTYARARCAEILNARSSTVWSPAHGVRQ